ncbi:ash family protein [Yersinia thracica]|nr:ash family protein [Yersinia thracica]
MTISGIRGYIPYTPAKSGVGICTLYITTTHSRVCGFFMRNV